MTSSTRFRAQLRTGTVTRLPGLISISLLSCVALLAICGTAAALDCDHCRRALAGQYTVYEGKNLHDRCYYDHYAQYCGICGEAITGQYYHNSWGDVVHAFHIGEFPNCEYCSRLTAENLTGKGTTYPDGRRVCGICNATAVTDTKHATALMDTVVSMLRRHGIDVDHDLTLQLIDKLEMSSISPATGREAWGFTEFRECRSWFGLVRSRETAVYVLTGMPREFLMGVLAHELMHVWVFDHAPADTDVALDEGSCEYASYLALKDLRGPYARFYLESLMSNDDLLYGGGYRSVRRYVQQVGVDGWLTYLKTNPEPPWD